MLLTMKPEVSEGEKSSWFFKHEIITLITNLSLPLFVVKVNEGLKKISLFNFCVNVLFPNLLSVMKYAMTKVIVECKR